jgi:hypothetical protein
LERSRTAIAVERPRSAEGVFGWQIAMLVGADMAFAMSFLVKFLHPSHAGSVPCCSTSPINLILTDLKGSEGITHGVGS